MKLKKNALKNVALLLVTAILFVACDKDFASVDSDIINEDTATNFNTTSEKYEVISYTNRLNPVQTNSLGVNFLGVYDDPIYGRTVSSIVTQLNSNLLDPTFGPDQTPNDVTLDSVVLSIPYFSTNEGVNEDGDSILYSLDSILPRAENYAPIKLSIFENNYFLRDFDPNEDFDANQEYFSDMSAGSNEPIPTSELEFVPITVIPELQISNEEIILTDNDETDATITERLSPRIRLLWNKDVAADASVIDYWNTKILAQEGQPTLSNSNNFNDYFRGLYFKAEPNDDDNDGSLLLLNLSQQEANVTLYYSYLSDITDGETVNAEYTMTFSPTRMHFEDSDFTMADMIGFSDGDEVNGDENLFLKGGEGAIAGIKLFNGDNADDDDTTDNAFETWRKQFVNLNEDGEFESSRRLVNEANLIFYVDQDLVNGMGVNGQEPDRLYLYNRTNAGPLLDYAQDSQNNTLPSLSIPNHLGILERDGDDGDKGIRYKMRITSHINTLLINDAENVELGIAVSGNVNLEASVGQYTEQTSDDEVKTLPVSSIITPRGTVLFGNNISINDPNYSKRLVLEIFYTCLETDIDCPN